MASTSKHGPRCNTKTAGAASSRAKSAAAASSRVGSALALGAAALAAGWVTLAQGCLTDTACIEWDESQGACPDREEALARMTVPCGRVQRVLSEGEFDEGTCCYDVRQLDEDREVVCGTGPGAGPPPPSTGPGPTGSTGTGSPCSGIIAGECGLCAEQACCNELLNCSASPACVDCVNNANCVDVSGAQVADALFGCIAAAQCEGDPCEVNFQPPPVCAAGARPAPSGGQCVVMGPAISCNPVTNEGCAVEQGKVCAPDGQGFSCASESYFNALCSGCGATGFCGPGAVCYGALCAELCCTNADCGGGQCTQTALPLPSGVGICVQSGP